VGSVDTAARAWTSPTLDGQLYGEPLVLGDKVYVATENDTVYALSAASARNVIAFSTAAAGAGRAAGVTRSAARDPRHYTSPGPATSGRMIAEVVLACLVAVGAFGWFIWLIRRQRRT
jgi:glucose dehydrogenase